jgi:hypothetical protein
MQGQEAIFVDIRSENLEAASARQLLEQVPGVGRVIIQDSEPGRALLEVETIEGSSVRGDLARAVVHAGWNLEDLRTAATSLEDIFLQLTASEKAKSGVPVAAPAAEVIQ